MTQQVEWANARSGVYRFLAAAYLAPLQKDFIVSLTTNGLIDQLEAVFGDAAVRELREFSRGFRGDYESLDQEFQDLFMVPVGRYVTPYEAVYRDERQIGDSLVRGFLMGPSTLAIKQLYREAGVMISEDYKDLPDHIGLELACMEFLCQAEAEVQQKSDFNEIQRLRGLQKKLLHEHLLQWAPQLCFRIRQNAPGPLYRGIAGLTEASLNWDAEFLASKASVRAGGRSRKFRSNPAAMSGLVRRTM
jgi:TorA maturation chaperone TorD